MASLAIQAMWTLWAFLLFSALAKGGVAALTASQEKALGKKVYIEQNLVTASSEPLEAGKVRDVPVPNGAPTPRKPTQTGTSASIIRGAVFVVKGTTVNGLTLNRPENGGPYGVPVPTNLSTSANAVSYEAIQFRVTVRGTYTIQSIATGAWDNFCLLYSASFVDTAPLSRLLASNDDNPRIGECRVRLTLAVGNYIFVSTGFGNSKYGSYSIYSLGPARLQLQTLLYTATTVGGAIMRRTVNRNPGIQVRFDSFRFKVSTSGVYRLLSTAAEPLTYDHVCVLYNAPVNTLNPLSGIIASNDDFRSICHCLLPRVSLRASVTYYFVISSYGANITGWVHNSISGPGVITPLPGTIRFSQTTSPRIAWQRVMVNGGWSSTTATGFTTTQLCVSSSGTFNFTQIVSPKIWDNFLVLYNGTFNPSWPTDKFIIANDDDARVGRSSFRTGLSKGTVYILVTTGFSNLSFGTAVTTITGPGVISTGPKACP